MTEKSLGVAVIGAGMVGPRPRRRLPRRQPALRPRPPRDPPGRRRRRARAVRRRRAPSGSATSGRRPPGRPSSTRRDIDVVSVAIANELHRPVVEALLAAGKHVLCEKPLAPSVEDAKAMVAAAEAADTQSGVGFSFRRTPGINAIREQLESGAIGDGPPLQRPLLVRLRAEPEQPDELALQGRPGHGRAGRHRQPHDRPRASTSAVRSPASAVRSSRPSPPSVRCRSAPSSATRPAPWVTPRSRSTTRTSRRSPPRFANGAVGTFSISRISHGLPNGLGFEVFAADGAAAFDLNRPGEFTFADHGPDGKTNGYRSVLIGPQHPGIEQGHRRWTSRPSATARTTCSPGRPAPSSTRCAGLGKLAPVPSLAHGLHNMEILAAVTQSALNGGQAVTLA